MNSLDKNSKDIAKKLIKDILQNPLRKSEIMKHKYKGLRKRKRGRVRILFTLCSECRERGEEKIRNCPICKETEDNTLIFFHVGLRGILY